MDTLFKVAFIAQPTGAVTESQGSVKAAKEYLAFQIPYDLFRITVCLAVDQYCTVITVNHFPRLPGRRAVWRTAQAAVIATTSELTLESYPRGSDYGSWIYDLSINSPKLAGVLEESI